MFEDEEDENGAEKIILDQSFFLFITGAPGIHPPLPVGPRTTRPTDRHLWCVDPWPVIINSGCPDSGHFLKLKILLNRLIIRQLRRWETKMVKHLTYALIFFTNFFQEYSANRINSVYIEPGGF